MPEGFQSIQSICGIYPSLFIGEAKTVVQTVRELDKKLTIRIDGSLPILDRGVVLTVDQQTVLWPQLPGTARPFRLIPGLKAVAEVIPRVGQGGVCQGKLGLDRCSLDEGIAGFYKIKRPQTLQSLRV